MFSPMMTVVVLAVLWLIVVIPMLVKRKDERAGQRSAARFGTAMRALSSKRGLAGLTRSVAPDDYETTERVDSHAQTFVPGRAAARRPVPAAAEASLYPERIGKADMSEARRQMMARRRRSLTLLIAGTVIGLLWGVAAGGMLAWTVGLGFMLGLGGYLAFLRNQALRDRDRRANRQRRHLVAIDEGYDATEEVSIRSYESATVVRIDDEDVELRGMADTIDLTGLYAEEEYDERAMRRAV